MAHVFIAADRAPGEGRRRASRAFDTLREQPGLLSSEYEAGSLSAIVCASPMAPLDWVVEGGVAALVVGEAVDPASERRLGAGGLAASWNDKFRLESWDGFHALFRWDEEEGCLLVGADRLGLFPIHYLDLPGTVAVSTSPRLLRMHPSHVEELDPEGLVGLLATRAMYGGRTLSRGIRRLEPGRVLRLSLSEAPQELHQWSPTPHPDARDRGRRGEAEIQEMFHETFARAARRHFAAGTPGFQLLSGGLDSRMVSGLLRDQGMVPPAVTLGSWYETEAMSASLVARHLGRELGRVCNPFDLQERMADWVVDWEDLEAGFFFFLAPLVMTPDPFRARGERIFTGFQMDYVAGGSDIAPEDIPGDPDAYLRRVWGRLGLGLDEMRALLRPRWRGAVDAVAEHARAEFLAAEGTDYQKSWVLGLPLRERHHVGINAWRASFSSWPVLLTLDEDVLRTCLGIPLEFAAGRALQKSLVIRRWPDLARLPLDRNDFSDHSLLDDGRIGARRWIAGIRRRLHRHLGLDTRFYHRMASMDSPHWENIRRRAQEGRRAVLEWFEPEALDAWLPEYGTPLPRYQDGITDSIRAKNLIGLQLRAVRNAA